MAFSALKKLLARKRTEPKATLIEILERLSEAERAFFVKGLIHKGEIDKIPESYIHSAIDYFGRDEHKLHKESRFLDAIPLAIKAGMLEMAVDLAAVEIGDRFKIGKQPMDERNVDAGVFHSILFSFGDKGKLIGLIPALEERGFFYSAGKICEESGLMERAVENYEKSQSYEQLLNIYFAQGKYELARKSACRAIADYEEKERFDDALKFAEIVGMQDHIPRLYKELIEKIEKKGYQDCYYTAFALARIGMIEEALELMHRMPEFKPAMKAKGYSVIADMVLKRGDEEKAKEIYKLSREYHKHDGNFLGASKVSEILGDEENAVFYQTIHKLIEES